MGDGGAGWGNPERNETTITRITARTGVPLTVVIVENLLFPAVRHNQAVRRSEFSKNRGMGNPGIATGRKSIYKWLRGIRGQ